MADAGFAGSAVDRDAAVSIRRLANDRAAEVGERFDAGEGSLFEFLCECGDPYCTSIVELTLAAYHEREPGSVVGHD